MRYLTYSDCSLFVLVGLSSPKKGGNRGKGPPPFRFCFWFFLFFSALSECCNLRRNTFLIKKNKIKMILILIPDF